MHIRPPTLVTIITAHRINQECGDVILIGAIWGRDRDVCVYLRHMGIHHADIPLGGLSSNDFTALRSKFYRLFAMFTGIVNTDNPHMEIISHGGPVTSSVDNYNPRKKEEAE